MFRPAMARASSVSRDEGLSPAAAKALLDPRVSSAVAAALWELMQEQGGAMPGGSWLYAYMCISISTTLL